MRKNIIITVIITLIVGIIICIYGFVMMSAASDFGIRGSVAYGLVIVAVLAGLIYAVINNMKERFKEIKEEEKDDLSKY